MSSYIKLIIFVAVLLLVSVAIVFIDSSMDNINESMPNISDHIVQGDKDYNMSVDLVNNKKFDESMEKAISAGNNFNNSLNQLLNIKNKFYKDLNNVHKDYIDTSIDELELKLNAVDELKQSIDYFKRYYNYTGSTHATKANDIMYDAVEYQNQRNVIVENNLKLFD